LNQDAVDNQNRLLPNSNVTLELGLAIGHGKKFIMLAESGTTIIADLQGYLRIEYSTMEEIPKRVNEQDFSKF
jgi:predicted nucleotide-binding protein